MGSKLKGCIFLLFNFAFLILFLHKSDGVVLIISDAGKSLNTSGEILDTIGKQQCVRECMQRGDCLSVNYWRSELRCQLNPSTVGPGVVLVPDVNSVYIEKASQPQDLLSGPCSSYACADRCTELSSGTTSCIAVYSAPPISSATTTSPTTTTTIPTTTTNPATSSPTTTSPTTTTNPATSSPTTTTTTTIQTTTTTSPTTTQATTSSTTTTINPTTSPTTTSPITTSPTTSPSLTTTSPTTTTTAPSTTSTGSTISCPSNFVWNPSVGLCYKVEEVPLIWQDAKVSCESKGSRLAILNIPPKLDVIAGDYTAGLLLNYQYYIGASYDAYLSDWKWVNGLIVDPVFLMNYLVTGGSGNCLVWDDTYGLSDVPCSTSMPFICEVPVYTASPPTSLPPMTPSTAFTTTSSACPTSFILNPSINLCYHVVEITMLWLDARGHCEAMGARLAVLDTPGKLNAILNDYTGGLLLHYNYFIGADFDDIAVEYKWVTNVLVDSIGFLSNYPVTRVTGHCLMWSDLDMLRDYPCNNPLPSICEIPVGTPTAPTGAPSCPYIWKPGVSLCYNNVEETHKWFEGNTTCINSGGRLAILNTHEKLTAVLNDYDFGEILFSNQYHIGGQYVSGIGWEWVDGSPVDPTFLAYYGIIDVDGDCLIWDSMNVLAQDKCDSSLRILCETVMTIDSS